MRTARLVGAGNRILRYFRLAEQGTPIAHAQAYENRAPRQSHRLPLEVRSWWLERSLAMRLGIPPDSQNAKQPHRQAGRGLLHDPSACKTPKQSCKCVPQDSLVQATESCVIFVSPNRAPRSRMHKPTKTVHLVKAIDCLLRCAVGGWKGRLRCVLGFPRLAKRKTTPQTSRQGSLARSVGLQDPKAVL